MVRRAQHARHRLLFDTTQWFSHPPAEPILDQLRGAVWSDRVCRLEYERADGIAKHYRADPYALVAKVDVGYLVADTARGMRFVAMNLNLVKGRREFLKLVDERLLGLGFHEKVVERSRYLSRA